MVPNFTGRQSECEEIISHATSECTRLVSIWLSPGLGKTSGTADSYYNLGTTQLSLGDLTSALESTQRALHIRLKRFGEEHTSIADSYHNLGTTQHSLGDFTSALESKQRALYIRLKLFGEEDASTANSYYSLATTQYCLGDFTSALESTQRALHIGLKQSKQRSREIRRRLFVVKKNCGNKV